MTMTSCCKRYQTSLTQEQINKFTVEMPDYPKKGTFTEKEQKYIAEIPSALKIYIFEVYSYESYTQTHSFYKMYFR